LPAAADGGEEHRQQKTDDFIGQENSAEKRRGHWAVDFHTLTRGLRYFSGFGSETGDALVFANHLAWPAVERRGPILRGRDGMERIENCQSLGAIVD
jgi:hypothetical protein